MFVAAAFGRGENKNPTIPVDKMDECSVKASGPRGGRKGEHPCFRSWLLYASWALSELFGVVQSREMRERGVQQSREKQQLQLLYTNGLRCCLLTGTFQHQLTASP